MFFFERSNESSLYNYDIMDRSSVIFCFRSARSRMWHLNICRTYDLLVSEFVCGHLAESYVFCNLNLSDSISRSNGTKVYYSLALLYLEIDVETLCK